MPDPTPPGRVRVQRRGDAFVLVDAKGKQLAKGEYADSAKASGAAAGINAAWRRAKAVRRQKGAPAITQEAAEVEEAWSPQARAAAAAARRQHAHGPAAALAAQHALKPHDELGGIGPNRLRTYDPDHGAPKARSVHVANVARHLDKGPGRVDLPSGVSVRHGPNSYVVRDAAGAEHALKHEGDETQARVRASGLAMRAHENGGHLPHGLKTKVGGRHHLFHALLDEVEEEARLDAEEGIFDRLKHPRGRGGEWRATLAAVHADPGHNSEYPDKGESRRIAALMKSGHIRSRSKMTTPDTTGEVELTELGKLALQTGRLGPKTEHGFDPDVMGYDERFLKQHVAGERSGAEERWGDTGRRVDVRRKLKPRSPDDPTGRWGTA